MRQRASIKGETGEVRLRELVRGERGEVGLKESLKGDMGKWVEGSQLEEKEGMKGRGRGCRWDFCSSTPCQMSSVQSFRGSLLDIVPVRGNARGCYVKLLGGGGAVARKSQRARHHISCSFFQLCVVHPSSA